MVTPQIQSLTVDVNLLKGVAFPGMSAGPDATCVKLLERSSFDGVRNAKTLENLFWDMEQYFKAAKVPEDKRVSLVGMYLTADAKLW